MRSQIKIIRALSVIFFVFTGVISTPANFFHKEAEIETTSVKLSLPKSFFRLLEKEVLATAYSSHKQAKTAVGVTPKWGVIAVDPKVIPLGSTVTIFDFPQKKFIALDTGKKIKGNRIDIWFPSFALAKNFGKRKMKILIHF